jgi:hypothetical protein
MATSGSHMVPTGPYSASSYVAPMQWTPLSYTAICLPHGAHSSHMALCGGCGSFMAHPVPLGAWSSYMAAYIAHMAQSGSHMAQVAPIQRTPLPYGPIRESCSSHMVPFASHMATSGSHMALWHTWLHHGTHGSTMVHMAPAWSPHSACGSHLAPAASNMVHTAPKQCTQLSYSPHMSHVAPT